MKQIGDKIKAPNSQTNEIKKVWCGRVLYVNT